jgi:hypothetical protein
MNDQATIAGQVERRVRRSTGDFARFCAAAFRGISSAIYQLIFPNGEIRFYSKSRKVGAKIAVKK